MRKQELIHLHALLLEIRHELTAKREVTAGAFDAYESHDVQPVAMHESKATHNEAVRHLLDGIESSITGCEDARKPGE